MTKNSVDDMASPGSWIWLSHVLAHNTPAYAGEPGLEVIQVKCMDHGDSCNTVRLGLSNHLGSHVDAPLHFVADGRSVDDYEPHDWIFRRPLMVDVPAGDSELVTPSHLEAACAPDARNADLLLIRTGFGRYRADERYWRHAPGFSADLAPWLRTRFPSVSAVALDCISLTSLQHRHEGGRAHRAFLANGFRIFEDLDLQNVANGFVLSGVIALPLRFTRGDGAPCSVIGLVSADSSIQSLRSTPGAHP